MSFVVIDDYNRVKLDVVDMPEYTDYVNASYIHVTCVILVFLLLNISKQIRSIRYKFNFEYKRLLEQSVVRLELGKKVEKHRQLFKIIEQFLKEFYILKYILN